MKFYVNLILLQLKSQMQYKASFFLTIAGQFLTAFTSFSAFPLCLTGWTL